MAKSDYTADNHNLHCDICNNKDTQYTLNPVFLSFYREYNRDKYFQTLRECRNKPRWICTDCYNELEP